MSHTQQKPCWTRHATCLIKKKQKMYHHCVHTFYRLYLKRELNGREKLKLNIVKWVTSSILSLKKCFLVRISLVWFSMHEEMISYVYTLH